MKVTKPRVIGDIGLRAFLQLLRKAKNIIENEKVDFIWLPIPSFYNGLLGRILYEKYNIPYGIDYIDPWLRNIDNQKNLRSRLSQFSAKILEPITVKKAAMISGVSTSYYEPVLQRNFPGFYNTHSKLKKTIINPSTGRPLTHVGMPYGFDPNDHRIEIENLDMPWNKEENIRPWIYAGAFLPNSHLFVDNLFKAIAYLKSVKAWDDSIKLYFIGTGPYPSKRITSYAKDHGIESAVIEYRERRPFLHVLNFLSRAERVMLIGSTEKHYTASKTFQCLLSNKPLFSILHAQSSAVDIIKKVSAGQFLIEYSNSMLPNELYLKIIEKLRGFQNEFTWTPNLDYLNKFSSRESARKLTNAINDIL